MRFDTEMWTLEYADTRFAEWIKKRDGKCQYPYCNQTTLDNSHFYIRSHSATRFDPDNCVALCRRHHDAWGTPVSSRNVEYTAFMIQRLAQERFDLLTRKANSIYKREQAILDLMVWM